MKPILFNTEMVRAILDGRKTVTRRVIRWDKVDNALSCPARRKNIEIPDDKIIERLCEAPYRMADILYVRETFFREDCISDCGGRSDPDECPFNRVGNSCYGYKAQYTTITGEIKWHPSIHMPKEAARIFLRVQDVHVERLQDITEDEAAKEGAEPAIELNTPEGPEILYAEDGYYAIGFKGVWDRTVKPADLPRYGWDANPWVWVIDFERISRDEAMRGEINVPNN